MNLLDLIQKKNILVIGDVMLDTYITGSIERISPEAPVPVFRKLREWSRPGGAANVAANLAAANQQVSLMALTGDDEAAKIIRAQLEQMSVDTTMLMPMQEHTICKNRFMAESNQQILRVDQEETKEISINIRNRLTGILTEYMARYDIVILSDYSKGLFSFEFTQDVIHIADQLGIKTLVDVKDKRAEKYAGAYLLKPNLTELQAMTGISIETQEDVLKAAIQLRETGKCTYVLTTLGGQGMLLVGEDSPLYIKADDHEVFDVTGAGDTALAYLASALANQLPIDQAVRLANHAAGLQVTKAGTATVELFELNEKFSEVTGVFAGKLLSRKKASQLRRLKPESKIVFTNGCFDILHIGHIRSLRQAAELGNILVVGLNSDNSVRRLKGAGRPINSEKERAEMLASLEFVDYIVIFEEDTPYELIREIQPDILAKSKDYKIEEIVGRDIVEAAGGEVVLLDYLDGKSTTETIQRIQQKKGHTNAGIDTKTSI